MAYEARATSNSPALIIYLIDVSQSMEEQVRTPTGPRRKIDLVTDALEAAAKTMVRRSTKGGVIAPRYRIAIYAYSEEVEDVLGRIVTVEELAQQGVPIFNPVATTDTNLAFMAAEFMLKDEISRGMFEPHPTTRVIPPAPLVCHLTDGMYNGDNPLTTVQRIMSLQVPDGNVLVENIFITDQALAQPLPPNIKQWPGVTSETYLVDNYARSLYNMSSPVPASYQGVMNEMGYALASNTRMFFPGMTPELVQLAFSMSSATKV